MPHKASIVWNKYSVAVADASTNIRLIEAGGNCGPELPNAYVEILTRYRIDAASVI